MNPMVGSMWKPSRTARVKKAKKARAKLDTREETEKRQVRRRDRGCRFPLCGCRRLKLRLEVSHVKHKGMGGNPAGDRSIAREMVQLCTHRHQFGAVSRHAGTLRAKYLTTRGFDGPVAWEADYGTLLRTVPRLMIVGRASDWVELARERAVSVLEPLDSWQTHILETLGAMEQ